MVPSLGFEFWVSGLSLELDGCRFAAAGGCKTVWGIKLGVWVHIWGLGYVVMAMITVAVMMAMVMAMKCGRWRFVLRRWNGRKHDSWLARLPFLDQAARGRCQCQL